MGHNQLHSLILCPSDGVSLSRRRNSVFRMYYCGGHVLNLISTEEGCGGREGGGLYSLFNSYEYLRKFLLSTHPFSY